MAGQEVNTLVDTGAARTLMAEDIFLKLCRSTNRPSLITPTDSVCGLGGKSLDVLGATEVNIPGAGPIRVLVTRGLPHALLLGSDAIMRGQGKVDYSTNTMTWYGQLYQLTAYPDGGPYAPVCIKETTGYAPIDEILDEYQETFSEPLGHCELIPFEIDTGDARPIRQRPYRTPLPRRKIVEDQLDDMIRTGVIEPSTSPWASPITLVPKKDGSMRFCVDYRKLNAVTKKDSYPLPLIQDIFDQLSGAAVFSTLDLKSGYWQLSVAEADRPKTAFICHRGLFQFRRMAFGLANAPAVFQRTMDRVLHGLVGVCCLVYIDDIVIYSRNAEEHAHHLQLVLDRLHKAGLKVKPSKCHFARTEVLLLGYLISKDGIRSDPEKTRAIATMKPPQTVSDIRSFLGMAGYYRQTIPNFATLAAPLTALTKKHAQWKWGEEQESAFRALQRLLQSDSVLAYPQMNRPYKLYTDACDYAVGGILVQQDETGMERVIQYVSQQLNGSQLRWATIEKEAYAIVYCLNKLRPYLWGANFEILTDHKPLRCLFKGEVANTKIQRWAVLIAEFGAPIHYREGRNNIRADMLSRIRPLEVDVVDTSCRVEPQAGCVTWSLPLKFDGIDLETLGLEQRAEFKEEWQQALDDTDEDYEIQEGVLYSCRRPGPRQAQYPRVLLPSRWHPSVIDRCHKQTGHAGVWKTVRAIQEAYVWTGMRRIVKAQLQHCAVCQVHKPRQQHVAPVRMPDPCYPHQVVSMDLTGPFTRSERGHVYLFTLIDHLTGWADAYPISHKRGEVIADILHRDYFPRYGAPEVLISDNGTEFVNAAVAELCTACDVEHRRTTPYHPQSNGKVERFHRTLKGILERLMTTTRSGWEAQLGPALSAYRNTVSSATGYTPFQALYGRQVRVPSSMALRGMEDSDAMGSDRIAALANVWKGARDHLRAEREANEARQRKKCLGAPLEVGDSVIVLLPGIHSNFAPRWDTRWDVIRARHPVYWIRHLPTGRERVLHREKLRWVPGDIDWSLTPASPVQDPVATPVVTIGASERAIDAPIDDCESMTPPNSDVAPPQLATSRKRSAPEVVQMDTQPAGMPQPPRSSNRKRRPPDRLGWEDDPKFGRFASVDCAY